MPNVVFVYSRRNQVATTIAYFDYVLAAFQARGALVIEEERFLVAGNQRFVPAGDRIVNFYCDKLNEVWQRCMPQFRWNYAIDEMAGPSGNAYATKIKQCKDFDCARTVVTYANTKHLWSLEAARISHVGMPCCPPKIRPRTSKPLAIAAFGTYHSVTYPERTRVRDVLIRAMGPSAVILHSAPLVNNSRKGDMEAYYRKLDDYQLGITCRGGYRDRMVNKYVEYGASHVLPVGDCPSYMPREMKDAMINTEGKDAKWVMNEVNRLLHTPQELVQRQEAYTDSVARNFNLLAHADRVLKTMVNI
jgi:hypothetical protein